MCVRVCVCVCVCVRERARYACVVRPCGLATVCVHAYFIYLDRKIAVIIHTDVILLLECFDMFGAQYSRVQGRIALP